MTKTPPPPIWLTGRERHTTPPLQPLCNKATKQTKTISLSVSLIVLVHVDRFHEQMACPTTPSINGIYYFATYYLSSSFSSYYYIGSTTVESKLFNHKHQNLRFRLRLPFCSSSSCFFYVLSALYVIGSHFVNLEQLRTITITILYDTFKPIFFLIQV